MLCNGLFFNVTLHATVSQKRQIYLGSIGIFRKMKVTRNRPFSYLYPDSIFSKIFQWNSAFWTQSLITIMHNKIYLGKTLLLVTGDSQFF